MKTHWTRARRRFVPAATPAAATITMLALGVTARADVVVYEPFDYPVGVIEGTTAGGVNLSGAYSTNVSVSTLEARVETPGLDYGSLIGAPAAAGNRLSQATSTTAVTATVGVDQDVLIGAGSEMYFSALFTFDDSANGNHLARITLRDDSNGDTIAFGEAAVGSGGIRLTASTAATGGLIAAGADGAFIDGQTLLLLGRYVNSAVADADSLELVGYDTADAVTLPTSFDSSDANAQFSYALSGRDIDFGTISSIDFTIRGAGNNFIDELRIGAGYEDVIAAPAVIPLPTAAGGGLALLGLSAIKRRR